MTLPPCAPVAGSNLDPALDHEWHPVARSRDLVRGGWLQARLLGRTWRLHRAADGALLADPPAHAVREHAGVVWVAPARPRNGLPLLPETGDRRFVVSWLPSVRTGDPAPLLVDRVRRWAQDGSPAGEVSGDGCRWLRVHLARAGGTTTFLALAQPEDDDSSRLHSCLAASAAPGRPLPFPADVAAEAAHLHRLLVERLTRAAQPAVGA